MIHSTSDLISYPIGFCFFFALSYWEEWKPLCLFVFFISLPGKGNSG